MSPTIERLAPEAAETLETVRRGLADSNRVRLLAQGKDLAMMQPHDLCLAARGAGRALLGGLIGQVKWNWLYVDILWVGETSRGQGVGAALLARAEREALALGAVGSWLMSTSFEAQDYYPRQGYTRFACLDDYAQDGSLAMFRKRLRVEKD